MYLAILLAFALAAEVTALPQSVSESSPPVLQLPHVLLTSRHVDGRLYYYQDDLLNHLYESSPWDLFLQDSLRTKRSTGYSFNTPDGVSRTESFDTYVDARVPDLHPLNRYQGSVSWTSPEGIPFTLTYVADGSGYHPVLHSGEPGSRSTPTF